MTRRDREHLRSIFLLRGHEEPVGPSELAKHIGVSKVGALQKMRRLEDRDCGDYIENEGLKLNERAVEIVERDIRNHHLIEQFLQDFLDMDFREACSESSRMTYSASEVLIKNIEKKIEDIDCECGFCLDPPYDPKELKDCHWCKELLEVGEG